MTPWTQDLIEDLGSWEELEALLQSPWQAVVAGTGSRRYELSRREESGRVSLLLRLPLDGGLRAQDRRRLHRLGMRLLAPGVWAATRSRPPLTRGQLRDVTALGAHLRASLALGTEVNTLAVEVLRDALHLDLDELSVEPEQEDPEGEEWDEGDVE